ncbi:unnamed protein product [Ectocarpus sp. 4 AP-2014]
MEDHFSRMLDASATGSAVQGTYIPAQHFEGKKLGYYFAKGIHGLGYYMDAAQASDIMDNDGEGTASRKRAREADDEAGRDLQNTGKQDPVRFEDMALEDLDEEAIARMLEEADKEEVSELDATGVKQLLLLLERKINRNQMMRVKFPEQPARFVDSEVELDAAIKSLSVVAATPELYPALVDAGAVNSLLGLLTHDNTDISITVLLLLQELTDSDVLSEREEASVIVDAIVNKLGLELLVQNLSRLDESNEEDAKGVNTTMGVLENLLEARPTLGPTLCEPPMSVLRFLLKRLQVKKFDENKLYCSEILAMLVNGDTDVQKRLGTLQGMDGIDRLLQIVAYYRRRQPQSPEEEECVENLFDALAAALLVPDNQQRFRKGEGFELMLRCLREKKHAAWCAVKVLDFALTDDSSNCERLVEVGGLKAVLPVFMGRGAARKLRQKKRKAKGERNALEEHAISIVTSFAVHLEDRPEHECLTRFISKFVEAGMEKVDRVMDLYMEYSDRVKQFEANEQQRAARDEEEGDSDDDAETLESRRLEAGAYTQQRLAVVMVVIAAHSSAVARRVNEKLHQHGWRLGHVRAVLEKYIQNLGPGSRQRGRLEALLPDAETEAPAAPGSTGAGSSGGDTPPPPPPPPADDDDDDVDMNVEDGGTPPPPPPPPPPRRSASPPPPPPPQDDGDDKSPALPPRAPPGADGGSSSRRNGGGGGGGRRSDDRDGGREERNGGGRDRRGGGERDRDNDSRGGRRGGDGERRGDRRGGERRGDRGRDDRRDDRRR